MQVLVVDPQGKLARAIEASCEGIAQVLDCRDFPAARKALFDHHPDLLVTDLRLGAYNGLHLVYLASTSGLRVRSVVFADPSDTMLASEAQRIGAFVEWPHRVAFAVQAYLAADLPPRDRRDLASYDRRREFRGGRRSADVPAAFNQHPFGNHPPQSAGGSFA